MLRPPYLDNGILYIRKRTLPDKQRNNRVIITWKRHVKERTKNKTKVNPKKTKRKKKSIKYHKEFVGSDDSDFK